MENFGQYEEEDLSDHIALHLRNDLISRGIVINREVQIRRGEKTDIYIDAISPHPGPAVYEKVSAIVEVKGCWNTGLRTAMKTQLVERYMNKNMVTHGLYLAGWFGSPRWDPKDRKRGICGHHSTDSLWLELQEQAHTASDSGLEVRAFVVDASY